jgi:phosphoglycolate phosphatase-like HAD superfamily hydrolase
MKILFDFDDVLFNTKAFKEHMRRIIEQEGVEDVHARYLALRERGIPFSLRDFLTSLLKEKGDAVIDRVYLTIMDSCAQYLSPRMVGLLQSLGKENCFVVTNGDQAFQEDKIRRSGVNDLISGYAIVGGSKRDEISAFCQAYADEQVIFIDNNRIFLDDLGGISNLTTFEYQGEEVFEAFTSLIERTKHLDEKDTEHVVRSMPSSGPKMM